MRELTKAEQAIPTGGGGAQPMPPVTVIGMMDSYQSTNGSVFSFGGVGGTGINVSDKPLFLKILGEYDYAKSYFDTNPQDVPTLGTVEVTAANVNVGQICYLEAQHVTNGFDPVMYNDGSGNPTIGCGFNLHDPAAKNFLAQTGDPTLIALLDPYVGLTVAEAAAKGLAPVYISQTQADELAQVTIQDSINEVSSMVPNFNSLPSAIATALVDADFNLGLPSFQTLVGAYVKSGDWNEVASILSSQAGQSSLIADGNAISAYLNAAHGNVGNGGGQGGSSRFAVIGHHTITRD